MEDPRLTAMKVLRDRGQVDAERTLACCKISIRHTDDQTLRQEGQPPFADVLIHAPGEVITEVRRGKPPTFDWGNQIERALRDAPEKGYQVRMVQWMETGPIDAPRPGTTGTGPRKGRPE